MREVFVDANYWIALANPRDQLHKAATRIGPTLANVHFVTTQELLSEFLNFFCKKGESLRKKAVEFIDAIVNDVTITVIPQSNESFERGVGLYQSRLDKDYSMPNCISMETMRERGIQDALTNDHHFEQEGFTILLKDHSA